jgi:hypothetical protein
MSKCRLWHRLPPLLPFRGCGPFSPPSSGGWGWGCYSPPCGFASFAPTHGSPAPVGYIYNATPDADRGLLATASAFFSHQGHQVFHNPCPDLDEYLQAMSVLSPIIPIDPLPDCILSSGLELMEGLFTPSPTTSFGTAFMAAYLVPPPSPRSVPLGGLAAPPGVSGGCLVAPGGVSTGSMLSPTRGISVTVGASPFNMGGLGVPQGIPVSNMGGLGRRQDPDKGISTPPRPHHGSPLPLLDPMHLPSYRPPTSRASSGLGIPPPLAAFGGFVGVPLSELHPPPLVCQPDPDEEGLASPPSHCSALFPSSVSWSGYLGERPGTQSSVDGYQGGHSLSLSSGSRGGSWGCSSSSSSGPSAPHHRGSGSSVGDKSDWAASSSDNILLSPIPLPVDWFTLPPIKSGEDYLQSRDLILYWLQTPGFSTAREDSLLVTDGRNALASQFWEVQIRMSLKDGSVRYLFENTNSKYFGKGFKMIQVLEDNFRPSSISNSFTNLLALFNDTQGDKEGIHKFCSRFEGHLGALSWSSVTIPPIL